MPSRNKKSEYKTSNNTGSIPELMKELLQAAVNLRGSIEPADYALEKGTEFALEFCDTHNCPLPAFGYPSG